MKKFWTILTVALVALGAVACSNNFEDEVVAPVEGISFTAAIDQTRTALEKDGDIYKTVWVGDETIVVSAEGASFEFKNSTAATSTFTCAEAGAAELLGKAVTLTYNKVIDSAKGAAGLTLAGESDAFAAESNITLTVGNAFLKFTAEADVTFTASKAIFGNGEALATTATVKAGEDVLVAVMAADACTLSFAINGVTCNSTTLNIVNNKIYNLGELKALKENAWRIMGLPSWDYNSAVKTYEKNAYAFVKNLNITGNFKLNDGTNWASPGSNVNANQIYTKFGNGDDMSIASGNYDIYLSKNAVWHGDGAYMRGWLCILPAGTDLKTVETSGQNKLYIVGNGNWGNNSTELAFDASVGCYIAKNVKLTGEFKVRFDTDGGWNHAWGTGGSLTPSVAADIYFNGGNINPTPGTYDIYTDLVKIWAMPVGEVPTF